VDPNDVDPKSIYDWFREKHGDDALIEAMTNKEYIEGLIDNQSVASAENLIEGCTLHYEACQRGDYQRAADLALQIAHRAEQLFMAHICVAMNREQD
jgi:hypothetical protein